jgi:uncharacterized membrane protein
MRDGGTMDGHCPMCGRQWDGHNYYTPAIPDSLPAPRNEEWIRRLGGVMARERLSEAQYRADSREYRLHMPYTMVIPQEENHIEWIGELYQAYGMAVPDSVPPVRQTDSGPEALRLGMELEQRLIPDYEWLIGNTDSDPTRQLLGDILYQTRMHHTMFQHALSMGGMRAPGGRGPGGHGPTGSQMGWGHMHRDWGGSSMMILWVILLAAVIYFAVRWAQRGGGPAGGGKESPIDILKRRYASGDISKEEFEERKRDL